MHAATRLLRWYRVHGRRLPWRKTKDPYRILVSEIMLQQTQVPRVLIFYAAWLKQFPNWKTLSAATNADVTRAWSGLGYNKRALALRNIARDVCERGVPGTYEEWLALKGIGPYTAAALSVFSLEQRATPIDTNIRRVVGRLFLAKLFPQPSDDARIAEVLDEKLMSHKEFVHVPQALFDLATMHCTKNPRCATCPMQSVCSSSKTFLRGDVVPPKQMVKKSHERKHSNKPHPDRIYRGRILSLLQNAKRVPILSLGARIDDAFDPTLDHAWLMHMLERLENDGLLLKTKTTIRLNDSMG